MKHKRYHRTSGVAAQDNLVGWCLIILAVVAILIGSK
jgi:hypothetical protein